MYPVGRGLIQNNTSYFDINEELNMMAFLIESLTPISALFSNVKFFTFDVPLIEAKLWIVQAVTLPYFKHVKSFQRLETLF